MGDIRPLTAPDSFSGDKAVSATADPGTPKYNQRLTDKILAAFNHAYSIGEADLACDLWDTLVAAEKVGAREISGRRPNQALELAALWMTFVDARNRYYTLNEVPEADPRDTGHAFEDMKAAYLQWVTHVRQG